MILRNKRQTIPIVCIVHFIITQYTKDSKQKFSFRLLEKQKSRPQRLLQTGSFFYRKNSIVILTPVTAASIRIPGLVKKHFRQRLSIHSPFR